MNTDGSATISLECLIPEFAIYKNLSVDYAQTISVTLKPVPPNSQNPSENSVNVTAEELKAWFVDTAENLSMRLGVILGSAISLISNKKLVNGLDEKALAPIMVAILEIIVVALCKILIY